jgi:hypothetical protein
MYSDVIYAFSFGLGGAILFAAHPADDQAAMLRQRPVVRP